MTQLWNPKAESTQNFTLRALRSSCFRSSSIPCFVRWACRF